MFPYKLVRNLCVQAQSINNYRIAGNFRGVQIFAFFEDAAKLKYRPSSTSKIAARELTAPNRIVHVALHRPCFCFCGIIQRKIERNADGR